MFTIIKHLMNRYLSQRAQGMVEYALLLAFVVVLVAFMYSGGTDNLSGAIQGVFSRVKGELQKAK